MSNEYPAYNQAITAARRQGIPVTPISQGDDAISAMVEKARSETSISEKRELAKIEASEKTLWHNLWGKTLANIAAYLLAFGIFALGSALMYRDKEGDADKAKWLIGLSSTAVFSSAVARAIRSLIDTKD